MRYIIVGAGAIGGVMAAGLHAAGREVVAIARGAHLDAIRGGGLRVERPGGATVTRIATAASPAELEIGAEDVVVLAVKSQDTEDVLRTLAGAADPAATVVCAQNGVSNERAALRRVANVIGMHVWMSTTHLEPGVAVVHTDPPGVLDVGRYPAGVAARGEAIAADLRRAGFDSRTQTEIMRWKYRKLLGNLANALTALLGPGGDRGGLAERARAEARACYAAAGIDPVGEEEYERRVGGLRAGLGALERPQPPGSSWQSVMRRTGTIEVDHLNGEIVLLGRLHGIPTPVNEVLQRTAGELARRGGLPGQITVSELERRIVACSAG